MAGLYCYLKELDKQRDRLANILTEKGIPSEESEKYNDLVNKVAQLGTGGGNAVPVDVAGAVDSLDSDVGVTTYETGDISDICEIVAERDTWGGTHTYIKPKSPAICLFFTNGRYSDYPAIYDMLIEQGWTLLGSVELTTDRSPSASVQYLSQVWMKKSDGGTVGVDGVYNSDPNLRMYYTAMVCLYGATSVEVIQAENPSFNISHSWVEENDSYTAYGFSLPAPTGKRRVYFLGTQVFGGDNPEITSDQNPSGSYGEPPQYEPTLCSDTSMNQQGATASFDMNSNNGLYCYIYEKKNPSPNYDISENWSPREFSAFTIDVNYD